LVSPRLCAQRGSSGLAYLGGSSCLTCRLRTQRFFVLE
jgi:hypothetical protein